MSLSLCLVVYLCIYLAFSLFIIHLYFCLLFYLSIYLSVFLSIYRLFKLQWYERYFCKPPLSQKLEGTASKVYDSLSQYLEHDLSLHTTRDKPKDSKKRKLIGCLRVMSYLCLVYVLLFVMSISCLCLVNVKYMSNLSIVYVLFMFCLILSRLCLELHYVVSTYCLYLVYVKYMSCLSKCCLFVSCLCLVYVKYKS